MFAVVDGHGEAGKEVAAFVVKTLSDSLTRVLQRYYENACTMTQCVFSILCCTRIRLLEKLHNFGFDLLFLIAHGSCSGDGSGVAQRIADAFMEVDAAVGTQFRGRDYDSGATATVVIHRHPALKHVTTLHEMS